MLDRDLEAPNITRTLRTGYPYSNRRHSKEPVIVEIVEVDEDEYIRIVNDRKVDT